MQIWYRSIKRLLWYARPYWHVQGIELMAWMKSQLELACCVSRISELRWRTVTWSTLEIQLLLARVRYWPIREIKRSPDTMKAAAILVSFVAIWSCLKDICDFYRPAFFVQLLGIGTFSQRKFDKPAVRVILNWLRQLKILHNISSAGK